MGIDALDDPYQAYSEALKEEGFQEYIQEGEGWKWRDRIIVEQFHSLKEPTDSVPDRLIQLKSFFMIFLGHQKNLKNLGGLFCQLFATCPVFSEHDGRKIFQFQKGKREIPGYTPDKSILQICENFMDEKLNDNVEPRQSELLEPQKEGIARNLVDEDPQEGSSPLTSDSTDDMIETQDNSFVEDLRTALKTLDNDKDLSLMSLNAIHRTAVFIILVLARRITKRDIDLVGVFRKGNIHRHYIDLVPQHLGNSILVPPPTALNKALDAVFSLGSEAGRVFGLLLLYAKSVNTMSVSSNPVGLLDQGNQSMNTILQASCMTHIAGAGLPLITLFMAVRALYNKNEKDAIKWLSFEELTQSLGRIVKVRLDHFQCKKDNIDVNLFPYCRLVHSNYHIDLSAKSNENMCYFMACLVDLRSPPVGGTGGAKAAMWTSSMNESVKQDLMDYASKFYAGTSGLKMTARFGAYNMGTPSGKSGKTWTAPKVQIAHDKTQQDEEDSFTLEEIE